LAAPVFATGDVPTADQFNDWFVNTRFARKPSIETISSNASLQNDDDLFVSVDASAVYMVKAVLRIASQTAADFQFGWTGPAGITFDWIAHSINSGGSTTNDDFIGAYGTASVPTVAGLGGSTVVAHVEGLLVMGANAGTFRLQWAQGTSNASGTSLLTNSFLFLRQVA